MVHDLLPGPPSSAKEHALGALRDPQCVSSFSRCLSVLCRQGLAGSCPRRLGDVARQSTSQQGLHGRFGSAAGMVARTRHAGPMALHWCCGQGVACPSSARVPSTPRTSSAQPILAMPALHRLQRGGSCLRNFRGELSRRAGCSDHFTTALRLGGGGYQADSALGAIRWSSRRTWPGVRWYA